MMKVSSYYKALFAAFAGTVAAALGNAMADGNITVNEAVASIGLGLSAGAVVWLAPRNAPPADDDPRYTSGFHLPADDEGGR